MFKAKHYTTIYIYLTLTITTLIVFWQVQNNDFVNFDDTIYILDNANINTGFTLKGVSWAFSSLHAGFWFPLTWISHMLDCQLYGLNPMGHHFNNLLFHIVNCLLLFMILNRTTKQKWKSAFVAALFAIHPLHVEPVAWISSRKDVLSTMFWLLTTWAYFYYTEKPSLARYSLVLMTFILGIMSKPMIITLPIVLLLMDYWPLNRIKHEVSSIKNISDKHEGISFLIPNAKIKCIILEKVPLIILSILAGIVVYLAELKYGALPSTDSNPLYIRLSNAVVSYSIYILKTFWPHNLTFFYPHTGLPSCWAIVISGFIMFSISYLSYKYRKKYPYFLIGWLWYMVTLIPVIGLIQVGSHAMADRYTYIPLIGVFIIVSWGITDLIKVKHAKWITIIAGTTIIFTLMYISYRQVKYWHNSESLFRHAIKVSPNNYTARNNLGILLFNKGKFSDALVQFSDALKISPNNLETHNNMGVILSRIGKTDEAIYHFLTILKVDPDSGGANFNLGIAYMHKHLYEKAIFHLLKALETDTGWREARYYLCIAYEKAGMIEKALDLKERDID